MRKLASVIVFVILLLIGFLATPGVFKAINPDYLIALRESRVPLGTMRDELLKTNKEIIEADSKIASLDKRLSELRIEATAKQATLAAANSPPETIANVAVEFGSKAGKLQIDLDQAKKVKDGLEEQKKGFEISQAEMRKKLDASAAESANLYLVARALALGAIGALMSIFAKVLSTTEKPLIFDDKGSLARMGASMAMGAIAAVIVMGLFFTGFISIFSHAEPVSGNPDFWKVTILCVLAGTFSDRLFQAAARRVEQYLGSARRTSKASSDPVGTKTPRKRPPLTQTRAAARQTRRKRSGPRAG